jgi:hypothetical protein
VTRAPRHFLAVAGVLALAVSASPARADVGDSESNYTPEPSTRRSDFTMGLHVGGAIGNVDGYPNEAAKLDVPEFEQSTGAGLGGGAALWVGLTPRDYFTFGLGLNRLELDGNGVKSIGTEFGVHIEVYPAFYQGGALEDLGVFLEAGAGPRTVVDSAGETVADGGFMSFVGMGAFWEPLRLGSHFNFGPFVEYTRQFSWTLTSNIVVIGARTTFFSGPG